MTATYHSRATGAPRYRGHTGKLTERPTSGQSAAKWRFRIAKLYFATAKEANLARRSAGSLERLVNEIALRRQLG